MKPLVSIVIPVYNGEKYIEDSIRSMSAQTYPNLQIIYVDDGSSDHTASILDAAVQKDSRFQVIHKKNEGVSTARNTGLAAATGEYISFFDVDDTVETTVIEDNARLAMEHQADVVMFGFWYYDVDTGIETTNGFAVDYAGDDKEFFAKHLVAAVQQEFFNAPWNKLIRRELLVQHHIKYDVRYSLYEDNLYEADIFNVAEKIVINPKMYYHYYIKSSGSLLTRFHDNIFEGLTLFYDRTMEYCNKYPDNEEQIRSFDAMYVMHTYTYLKQISCNRELDKKRKYELMQQICNNSKLLKALDHVELHGRKKLIRLLIKEQKYGAISMIYRMVSRMQLH